MEASDWILLAVKIIAQLTVLWAGVSALFSDLYVKDGPDGRRHLTRAGRVHLLALFTGLVVFGSSELVDEFRKAHDKQAEVEETKAKKAAEVRAVEAKKELDLLINSAESSKASQKQMLDAEQNAITAQKNQLATQLKASSIIHDLREAQVLSQIPLNRLTFSFSLSSKHSRYVKQLVYDFARQERPAMKGIDKDFIQYLHVLYDARGQKAHLHIFDGSKGQSLVMNKSEDAALSEFIHDLIHLGCFDLVVSSSRSPVQLVSSNLVLRRWEIYNDLMYAEFDLSGVGADWADKASVTILAEPLEVDTIDSHHTIENLHREILPDFLTIGLSGPQLRTGAYVHPNWGHAPNYSSFQGFATGPHSLSDGEFVEFPDVASDSSWWGHMPPFPEL